MRERVSTHVSLLEIHHLVASESGVERFFERHEVRLFTHEQYLSAFTAAGLVVVFDAESLTGAACTWGSPAHASTRRWRLDGTSLARR